MAVSLILPLSVLAANSDIYHLFDKNKDGIIDRTDWRKMNKDERKTYARMSLEDIGENPDAFVAKDKTREKFLLEGLEAIYNQ